jgi:hypothetical protein
VVVVEEWLATQMHVHKYGAGGGVLDPSIPRQGQEY